MIYSENSSIKQIMVINRLLLLPHLANTEQQKHAGNVIKGTLILSSFTDHHIRLYFYEDV